MPDAVPAPAPAAPPALAAELIELLLGYQRTQLLSVAAKLGLADLLAAGPQSVEALAAATNADAPSLYRVLRALASLGVFAERADGRFELTPLAALLQSGTPGSLRATVLAHGEDFYPAPLKNARDYLNQKWAYNPVGFVSYGGVSAGTRAMQMLKQVVAALKMMPLLEAVNIPCVGQFMTHGQFQPNEVTEQAATLLLGELVR